MNTIDIIIRKRDGGELDAGQIRYLIDGYTKGTIPDYQMSAFLMAVCLRGMNKAETAALTEAMRFSGDVIDLSCIRGIKVDKHSTGGVGDKTTLIAGPLAASCGVPVAKMSGRGLGFTGGTVDKLSSIPGYRVTLDRQEFTDQVNSTGIAVISQTGDIAPADKKIYALRDVTGTVENISLITSSIMSKKLASGSDAILLDVKCGSGAFMKTPEEAERLASLMVETGKAAGRDTMAVITDMEQPLGRAAGNSLEVMEAVDVLSGRGAEDITELSVRLAGMMIFLGKKSDSVEEGTEKAYNHIMNGKGLKKFKQLVSAQGGDPAIAEDPGLLPQSSMSVQLRADRDGYVSHIDAMKIGTASGMTGAGRQTKDDEIDLSAGIYIDRKPGEKVCRGDTICTLYGNDAERISDALEVARGAVTVSAQAPEKRKLIIGMIK